MRLLDIFNPLNVAKTQAIGQLKPAQNQNESASKPCSWGIGGGSDTVKISPEAYAAMEAAKKDSQAQAKPEENDPRQEFKTYMNEARGQNTSNGLEGLKKRLKALEKKLAKISQDDKMSDEAKASAIHSLQEQIQMILAQIGKAV